MGVVRFKTGYRGGSFNWISSRGRGYYWRTVNEIGHVLGPQIINWFRSFWCHKNTHVRINKWSHDFLVNSVYYPIIYANRGEDQVFGVIYFCLWLFVSVLRYLLLNFVVCDSPVFTSHSPLLEKVNIGLFSFSFAIICISCKQLEFTYDIRYWGQHYIE